VNRSWGAYIHVPWCRTRCPYCAFEILTGDENPAEERWADGVRADWDRWRPSFSGPPSTLYFGGGTPSRVSVHTLQTLHEEFGSPPVTVEANPEDIGEGWLEDAVSAGFDRISLGVQTLQPRLRRVVGRDHHDGHAALAKVASAGLRSWSADLIFALPGQTADELERDLDALLAYEPPHVSIYGLTIEPDTGFGRLDARRRLPVPDDETWRWMYARIVERLAEAGLDRYEVSNFARPGHRSAHNQLYWTGHPYMGLGPSAHGFAPDGRRWCNSSWPGWLQQTPPQIESPDPIQRATDFLVSSMRGSSGIAPRELAPAQLDQRSIDQLVRAGLITDCSGRLALTDEGFFVADAVVRALATGLRVPTTG